MKSATTSPDLSPPEPIKETTMDFFSWCKIALLLLLVGGLYLWSRQAQDYGVSKAGVVMHLPDSVGNFWGIDQPVSEGEKVILPRDTEFAKKFYKTGSDEINCQIVLAGAEKRSIHRPEVCLPAQGWNLKSGEIIHVPLKSGTSLPVMRLLISRPYETSPGVKKELTSYYLYWFVGDGITTADHKERLWRTVTDKVLHYINHRWAYVIVSAPITQGFRYNGKDEKETLEMLEKFIQGVAPTFMLSEKQASKNK
ncbi:MAG: exosortase C-terminal domain/associated protein EpsI [Chthoniobacterales bacterium]